MVLIFAPFIDGYEDIMPHTNNKLFLQNYRFSLPMISIIDSIQILCNTRVEILIHW